MNASPISLLRRSSRSTLWSLGAFTLIMALMVAMGIESSVRADGMSQSAIAPVSWAQDDTTASPDTSTDVQPTANPVIDTAIDQAIEQATAPSMYVARLNEPNTTGFDPLGDLDNLDQRTAIEFSVSGAGIRSLQLPDDFETVAGLNHVTLQAQVQVNPDSNPAVPFTALMVVINGESVLIIGDDDAPVWSQIAVGTFEAFVDDRDGNPIVRLERKFTLKPNSQHGFYLAETIENLSSQRISAKLITTGAIDMPKAVSSYGGDRRRFRYGYMLMPEQQSTSMAVTVDDELTNRNKILGKRVSSQYGKAYPNAMMVWPNEQLLPGAQRLSWFAFSDRYFIVAMHPQFDPATTVPEAKLLNGIASIDRLMLDLYASPLDAVQVLRLTGVEHQIAAGSSVTNTLGVYAGPRNRPIMNGEPEVASLNMPAMVVSNLGGLCAPCTFSWLTDILIGVLRTFHSIVGDWAVSILLLVVLVRGCLHPVTRWSQIRVQRFSVQMQAMAPKQKAIREKYKDDSKKQQAEMSKLWREEGISPAGMLGCLPMFLQSPVWIALYATLFFASELRHEAAFYGVFQNVFNWGFMNDLSAPDGAIPLPASMHFSFAMWGSVTSINVLPLLLGVVFYLHQKYLTPPTQATMTPEQESQQKMMKIMMVFMFPVMMYAAPSGLALYFITNSAMGIIENKWIRAHMKKHGMLEIENIRASKKDKGPGFLARMTDAAEAQKQLKEHGPRQPNPASKQSRRGQK
ncbi:hypothetical protein COB72_03940 [bacterium]|nr:MAG: hypothetical protein COB72_03940 [bacterium]